MEHIRRSKTSLVEWFTSDPDFILQMVQEDALVTQREYHKLKAENDPEKRIINLLDTIMGKGQSSCELFCQVLQKDKVKETYPKLIEWLSSKQQAPSGPTLSGRRVITADIHAAGGSFVVCPMIQTSQTSTISIPVNFNSPGDNRNVEKDLPIGSTKEMSVKELEDKVTDKKSFLKENWANLVRKVKQVDELADQMMGHGLTNEMYSNIMACQTPEQKMRKLLGYVTTTDVASGHLFTALCTLNSYIMQELIQ
ncbi:uncharacterized protein si:dkey-10c21.1 [Pristis pectinata]|uniref:uncharacterized protein si:dkey-10c21.1 n=1 Tax=Pristis pectinata TaxID=685728 RepID=UPI00223DCAF6|nr:uncharacterized protein si:dkey-10c21.1 [Pristis pectinata]XP_051886796.1 uncharacterized protein si:dkey-10c21.1 [Pristis pectinata]XP_051886802.1 uncharacterized protein si:dkey-10c21.1 [Pristis pectinata]